MEIVLICSTAFLASGLTLFSGFGLGTILMPVLALFFPIDLAIALTAIVHFLNNLFKLALLGRHADKKIVIRFGISSIVFAFAGAWCLRYLTDLSPIADYYFVGHTYVISPLNLIIAVLVFVFSLFDLIPQFSRLSFHQKFLPLGGALSGFAGGLSGNQGALRTAFLIKANLSKESFIATGVLIACLTDVSRLVVYTGQIMKTSEPINIKLVAAATLSAFIGAYLGNRLLKKVTVHILQVMVGIMLILFSAALGLGFI